jgi:polysaccharide chain length determinant protein (PEP-CTERM system associated)
MDTKLIFYYLQGIWRRRWIVVAICWSICIAGWTGVFRLHDVYDSSARVYVDVNSLLGPLLAGLAIGSNPLQQLDYMQRTLLSRPNLEQVIHLADLDSIAKTPNQKDALIADLAGSVHIGLQGNNIFSIDYHDSNPVQAKNVVQAVLTVFSETSAGNSRAQMDEAQRFLREQIASYERQLREAETRRVDFQTKYGDVLSQEAGNKSRLSQLHDEIEKLQLTLQDAQGRRDAIAKQLATVPQTLTLDQAASVIVNMGQPNDIQSQIAAERQKLFDLQSRFTDDYPDVISQKRYIASLEERAKEQPDGADKDGGTGPDASRKSTTSNPVYEQLKLRLADADASIASIERQIKASTDEEQKIKAEVDSAPGIQLQADNLNRDYGILKGNYDQLVSRLQAATLGQAADTQADKIQFRIIDAPQVPLHPIAPNRPLLYTGVLIVGFGSGVAAAFLLLQLDRSFSNISSLRELGLPVLGTVSRVIVIGTRRRFIREIGGLAGSAVALLVVYGTLLFADASSFHGVI